MSKLKKFWVKNWHPIHETVFFGTKINYILSQDRAAVTALSETVKILHSISEGEFFVHLRELGGHAGIALQPDKDVELNVSVQGDFHDWNYKICFREAIGVLSFEESIYRDDEPLCRNSGQEAPDKYLLLENEETRTLSELQDCFESISIHTAQDLYHWQELVPFLESDRSEEFFKISDAILAHLFENVGEGSTEDLLKSHDRLTREIMCFLGMLYKVYLGRRIIIVENPEDFMPDKVVTHLPQIFEFIEDKAGRKNQIFIFSNPRFSLPNSTTRKSTKRC